MANYPKIMGILNVTPDSFYDGGRHFTKEDAILKGYDLISQGADIIDIGGESTRPGFEQVSASEEIDRICPVIEKISKENVPISVDTIKPETAQAAIKAGATIINDVSGKSIESGMFELSIKTKCGIIFTHNSRNQNINLHESREDIADIKENIKENKENIKEDIEEDIVKEIIKFFDETIIKAIKAGVKKENIILDPGIGFGKKFDDNYKILNNVNKFKECGYPILIGLSRKSMIGQLFNQNEDRLPATLALNCAAFFAGADIIRVHDVKAHKMAFKALIKMFDVREVKVNA
jgi:dihydropteroate synthase